MKKMPFLILSLCLLAFAFPTFVSASLATLPTLKYGDIRPEVRTLQEALNSIGQNISRSGEETTRFGEKTLFSIKDLQCTHNIVCAGDPSHGIFGPQTKGLLMTLQQRTLSPRVLGASTEGLVAHYAFDGSASDSAGSNNGTAIGGPTYSAGKIGQAIQMDGVDDYVNVPDIIEGLSAITVSSWVKTNDLSGKVQRIIKQTGGGADPINFDFASGTEGNDYKFRCVIGNAAVNISSGNTAQFRDTNWHHVACVYNGTDIRVYVDGSLSNSPAAQTGALPATANDLVISSDVAGESWSGNLDDFRIYNRALTATEIRDIYNLSGDTGGAATAPAVSITSPANGATVSGSVNISATASGAGGISNVQFKLDGNNIGSADASAPYSTSWNTAGVSNGTHMLTAIATDVAGNARTSSAVSVTVSNLVAVDPAPVITPTSCDTPRYTLNDVIRDNMTWVILGDSITSAQGYSNYMEAYFQLMNPGKNLHFRGGGRGGSHMGEVLDAVASEDGSKSAIEMGRLLNGDRFVRNVQPLNPTVVSILFGSNSAPSPTEYANDLLNLTCNYVIGRSNAIPVLLGPAPVNSLGGGAPLHDNYSVKLAELAVAKGWVYADIWSYLHDLFAPANPATGLRSLQTLASLQGADALHPGPSGHLATTYAMLDKMGATGDVSSVKINASGATPVVTEATRAIVSGLSKTGDTVNFRRLDSRLPGAFPDAAREIFKLMPWILDDMYNYDLTITGLSPGTYEIWISNDTGAMVKSGTVSSNDLATGYNLSAMTEGPIHDQLESVLSAIRIKEGLTPDSIEIIGPPTLAPNTGVNSFVSTARSVYSDLTTVTPTRTESQILRGEALGDAIANTPSVIAKRDAINTLDQNIYTAARPRARDFSIRKISSDVATVFNLIVSKSGTGAGTVTGAGISCGSDCSDSVNAGTSVILTATPSAGSTFTGWSGACSGTGTCTVILSANQTVTATFALSSAVPNKFASGNRVKVNANNVNVRGTPTTDDLPSGQHNLGDLGTVDANPPAIANGYTWWRIDFDSGVDGWMVENYLDVAAGAADVTAPALSGGAPTGVLSRDTGTATLSAATNENATCKYGTSANAAYASIANTFTTTGAKAHSASISGLQNGNSYSYYVRCRDAAGNANVSDYAISFSVSDSVVPYLPPPTAGSPKAWSYPAVPYTDWEYDPFTHAAPARPTEWPSAGKQNYYFIAPDDINATDAATGGEPVDANGKRFGYPNKPRKTLPLVSKNFNSFPAGTVFWMKGGEYNTVYGTGDVFNISSRSTADNPFWVYGDPSDKPVFRNARILIYNSSYGFIENIIFDDGTKGSGTMSFGRSDAEGDTHHITVRNIDIKNRRYVAHGGLISVDAPEGTVVNGDIHDIVFYKIKFKNNGGGVDWNAVDADMHGYKLNGSWNQNRAYRIWVIENDVRKGDAPDPIDGFYKSVAGNFMQVGDQNVMQGNVDHVWIAGNYSEGTRQGCVGFKRSGHAVASSNTCKDLAQAGTSQGQAFNIKYDRQENLWFVNNYAENVDSFIIRAETTSSGAGGPDTFSPINTRVHIIGNVFKNNMREPWNAPDMGGIGGWKTKGISIQDMNGKVYIANNVIDTSVYGVYFDPHSHRQSAGSEMHVYNNIAVNLSAGLDRSTAANNGIMITTDTDSEWFIENNLVDSGRFYYSGTQYNSAADFNARANASGNMQGDPMFTNPAAGDYSLRPGSPAIDAGIQNYTTNRSLDVYQLFIDAFANDPDFPGNPADVWPKDRNNNARLSGSRIDIGAYESNGTTLPTPPTDSTFPTISITSPSGAISGTVAISATASDNVGVAGVRFKLGGVDIGIEDTVAPYEGSWNTAGIINGVHTLTAIARDAAGNKTTSSPVIVTITNSVNHAPVANAGSDQTIPLTSPVTLSGSASSDPDLDSLTYVWSKVSGPNSYALANTTSVSPTVSFTAKGTYAFSLTVSDGSLASSDTVTVTVKDAVSVIEDRDNDGVEDALDRCPNTPAHMKSKVNRKGCIKPRLAGFDIKPDLERDIDALDDAEIGKAGIGKVLFKERVSFAREAEELNIEDNLVIERNKVSLNAVNLPELNKKAEIALEISFQNPKILKDGQGCSECVIKRFANGVLVFEVLGFSAYEVVEGTLPPVIDPLAGGGGSAGKGWTGTLALTTGGSGATVSCAPGQTFHTATGQRCTTATGGAQQGASAAYAFARNLTMGAKGEDVRQLQVFLNASGFAVATAGAGSPGNETTTFGPATRAALARYQASKGIAPAAGYFGPATRASVQGTGPNVFLPPPASTQAPSPATGTTLRLGSFGPAVRLLRQKLRDLGYFAAYGSAPDVPASASVETSTFGATTESAVRKFQCDRSIVCTGSAATTGWGSVGPRTRGALGM